MATENSQMSRAGRVEPPKEVSVSVSGETTSLPASKVSPDKFSWQTAFDAIREPIWLMDTECRIQQCNQAARIQFGNDIVGRHCWEVAHGATGRKKSEDVTAWARQHYRLLFETMLHGVVYQDAAGKIISMNPAAEEILGRTREDFLGRTSVDEEHHTLREDGSPFPGREHPAMVALQTGREVRNVVMGVFNPRRKEYRWININAVPVFLPGHDKPQQVYTMFYDITERNRTEAGLQESEQNFRQVVENIKGAFWLTDAETGRLIFISPTYEQIWGRNCASLYASPESWLAAICPEDRERVQQVWTRQSDGDFNVEYRIWRPDGTVLWIHDRAFPVRNARGEVYRIAGIAEDITRRKQEEAALRESEEKFRRLFATVSDAILIFDAETRKFVDANDAALRMYGYTREEMHSLTTRDMTAEPEASDKSITETLNGASKNIPLRYHKRKDGTIFPVEIAASSLVVEGRKLYCGIIHDITERKHSEWLLQEANHTLQAIRDCHEAMLRASTEEKLLREICRIIVQTSGERMAWVGFAENDARKTVRPVAQAGAAKEYLARVNVTWADQPRGRGPVGTAIRTGKVRIIRDTQTDPSFAPWREGARRCGYGSVIALPLKSGSHCFGALSIYAPKPDAFDAAEQLLLTDLANDLAFGITTLRLRAERERLEQEILNSVEQEQGRIGRDLHDGLCQMLVGAKFRCGSMRTMPQAQFGQVKREAGRLEEILNQAIEQARNLARGLNPVKISPTGLTTALQSLADNVNVENAAGLNCFCRFPARVKITSHETANHLYRIAQEAVQNAVKHARARNISITLDRQNRRVILLVKDDGRGIPAKPRKTGMGLDNMRTRASLIGAELKVRRRKFGGTEVRCVCRPTIQKAKP